MWAIANAKERWPSYAGQVAALVNAWEPLLRNEHVLVAGDLNCSARGPSGAPHVANIEQLASIGGRLLGRQSPETSNPQAHLHVLP